MPPFKNRSKCAVIIVTHNSERYLSHAIDSLKKQTRCADQIIIVDSGSNNTEYLLPFREQESITLALFRSNIGFCKGNNLGMALLNIPCDYVLFLNPDAFLTPSFLEDAITFMDNPIHEKCGAMTGTLLGYDIETGKPSGKYDSTGIFNTWYGKWFDRDQGRDSGSAAYTTIETLPAICGALMLCRKAALETVLIDKNEVFDERFWMYKEDIDLSCRLTAAGWQLLYNPMCIAYHCRGWNSKRAEVPRHLRILSAKNELRIHLKLRSPVKIMYSSLKYLGVKVLDL
jgi:GT2 family glycosyltransferase